MSLSLEIWKKDLEAFNKHFGADSGKIVWVAAPGRVNLIGEHTDYHEGFVLPASIDRQVRLLSRKRDDGKVAIYSQTFNDRYEFDLGGEMSDIGGWARRAEGIIRTVLENTESPSGFDIYMDADLSVGGGLSSSAASMAVLGTLAAYMNGFELDKLEFGKTLQAAEHRFAGLKCGIMDQLAILLGKEEHALLLDCRSLKTRHVHIPGKWSLVIMDTNVKHDLATSEYNKRQIECAAVLDILKKRRPEINSLRDVSMNELEIIKAECDPVGYKRCKHVIDENERVHLAVAALEAGDADTIGKLFAASHASLRDDYEVSCRELDALVDAAQDAPGLVGSRMTGGGFGGSVVNLVEATKTEEFIAHVSPRYKEATGIDAIAIDCKTSNGVTLGILE